jgi:hypothetical protein
MSMTITRRGLIAAGSAAALVAPARAQNRPLRIGVLNDMSGPSASTPA